MDGESLFFEEKMLTLQRLLNKSDHYSVSHKKHFTMKRMDYNFAHSAQGMMKQSERLRVGAPAGMNTTACGAACGAGDKLTL